jgi:hypothetical protein
MCLVFRVWLCVCFVVRRRQVITDAGKAELLSLELERRKHFYGGRTLAQSCFGHRYLTVVEGSDPADLLVRAEVVEPC